MNVTFIEYDEYAYRYRQPGPWGQSFIGVCKKWLQMTRFGASRHYDFLIQHLPWGCMYVATVERGSRKYYELVNLPHHQELKVPCFGKEGELLVDRVYVVRQVFGTLAPSGFTLVETSKQIPKGVVIKGFYGNLATRAAIETVKFSDGAWWASTYNYFTPYVSAIAPLAYKKV